MDDATKVEMNKIIDARMAEYISANSWWQKTRREHPLAVQNALGFGCLALGILLGRFGAPWLF